MSNRPSQVPVLDLPKTEGCVCCRRPGTQAVVVVLSPKEFPPTVRDRPGRTTRWTATIRCCDFCRFRPDFEQRATAKIREAFQARAN